MEQVATGSSYYGVFKSFTVLETTVRLFTIRKPSFAYSPNGIIASFFLNIDIAATLSHLTIMESSPFSTLSAELRNQIWVLAVTGPEIVTLEKYQMKPVNPGRFKGDPVPICEWKGDDDNDTSDISPPQIPRLVNLYAPDGPLALTRACR